MAIETLKTLASEIQTASLSALAGQATQSTFSDAGWTVNTSRQFVTPQIDAALLDHAAQIGLSGAIEDLFGAAIVNPSEQRPALHWALRLPPESSCHARTA